MKDLGVLVPIATPCSKDGKPDLDGMRVLCDDMLGAGVQALFPLGSTGRGPWFSAADRGAICKTVADYAGGRAVIFGGCMATGLPGMLENARAMADAGANIAVATCPAYFNYRMEEVEIIFRRFADESPLPVMIYDIPALAGMKLDLNLVLRLAAHENVIGVKDSSGDFDRFQEMAEALADDDGFYLLQGKEEYLAASLRAGASGFVVSFVHFAPKAFTALYRAVREGDDETADALQAKVSEVCAAFREMENSVPGISRLFYAIQILLERRGVDVNILMEHETGPAALVVETAEEVARILEV